MGKNSKKKNTSGKNLNKLALPLFSIAILVILTGVFFATKQNGNGTPVAPATGTLIETRPILSDAFFTGKVAMAYRIAAEIPKVLAGLGISIISTSIGIKTGSAASKLGVGGEILCHIW